MKPRCSSECAADFREVEAKLSTAVLLLIKPKSMRDDMAEDVRLILKSLPDVSFHTARNYQETFADKLRVIGDAARRIEAALNAPVADSV